MSVRALEDWELRLIAALSLPCYHCLRGTPTWAMRHAGQEIRVCEWCVSQERARVARRQGRTREGHERR